MSRNNIDYDVLNSLYEAGLPQGSMLGGDGAGAGDGDGDGAEAGAGEQDQNQNQNQDLFFHDDPTTACDLCCEYIGYWVKENPWCVATIGAAVVCAAVSAGLILTGVGSPLAILTGALGYKLATAGATAQTWQVVGSAGIGVLFVAALRALQAMINCVKQVARRGSTCLSGCFFRIKDTEISDTILPRSRRNSSDDEGDEDACNSYPRPGSY